jgi:putative ABC transport system permease protein
VEPTRYQPLSQVPWIGLYLVVKTTGSPMQMVPSIRQQLSQLDPDIPLTPARTMDQAMSRAVGQPRFRTMLLALFAALALVLATVGIYGVMSYSVTRRSKEIGIRMSLGASGIGVIRMVVREGLQLAVLGVTIGVVGGLVVTRFLGALLFQVQPTDPGTFVLLPLFLLVVAVGACLIPAYRATRVDPLRSLRTE